MKASRKGTRLNDPHNFKQPLPHLRNRMTAMCVLSKISALQDKIRATDYHDLIVGRADQRKLKSPSAKDRGGKIVRACENIDNDILKSDKNHRCAKCESPDGNELTIKIGLERTFMEKGISYKRERRDVADIIRNLKNDSIISVGQINSNECTEKLRDDKDDDGHDHGYCVSIKSPLPAVPPKGIGPILQHWESMIGQKGTSDSNYPRDEMRMIDDNEHHTSPFLNEAILHSKSSQFPSKAELLAKELTAAGINTFFNNEHNSKNRGCDVAMRTAKDIEPSASASRGGKLKRMALELLDILVANKKNANDIPSPTIVGSGSVRDSKQTSDATRMKTIYQRIPNYDNRIKERHIRRRTETHGDCGNISRTESTSRVSESTCREDAINYADTCTDTATALSFLQKKPSTGRVTPMEELNFDDWLMKELRSRQGIRLQL